MRTKNYLLSTAIFLLLSLVFSSTLNAQITVSTTHTNNNGNGSVIFNVQNTNTYDIIITGVNCHMGTSATNNVQLLYRTTPYSDFAAPWDFGTVGDGQNGWISAGSGTLATNTANGVVPALTNLSLVVPAGSTYQLGFSANTIQYMTLTSGGGVNTFSNGGVNLLTGDGISWGGVAYPGTPANYPRGFIGGITFIPSVACTGAPVVGLAAASVTSACPTATFNLTLPNAVITTGLTYQWQSSPSSTGPWTNIPSANSSVLSTTQSAATWYQCVVTCTSANLSTTSGAVQVGLSPFSDCYCSSIASYTGDEEIYNVTINGGSTNPLYSNANGCTSAAPGPGSILSRYSNFKTLPAITNVTAGQTVTFEILQDECDGATYYSNGIGMWIDFNQNGSFSDQDEAVFIEASTAAGPRTVTGSFTIPVTAMSGNTAVRIICAESYSGTQLQPCLMYGYGETEDYLINIIAANPCTGTPDGGTAISSLPTACPTESFTLSLDNATVASGVTYQWLLSTSVNGPWTTIPGATLSTLNATVSEDTYFACVLTCTNTSLVDTSASALVLSTPFLNCYCTSSANYTADEDLFNVTIGGIDNSSDCSTTGGAGSVVNQYSDYTADVAPAQMIQSVSYPISIEVGTCGTYNYSNWTKAWIDYNHNGSFDDPGEEVYSSTASTAGAHFENGTVDVPMTALTGLTRMRVKVVEFANASMSPCGNYGWGETEDYFVNILPAPDCANPDNITVTSGVDSVIASWDWSQTLLPATGYNLQLVNADMPFSTGTAYVLDANTNETIFNAAFISGQSFDVYLQTVCGQDTSYFIGPVSVVLPMSNDTICGAANIPVDGHTYVFNNTGAGFDASELTLAPPATGAQTTTGWENNNLELTTWFTFVAPTSGKVRINSTALSYNGQIAVYSASNCSNLASFQLVAANDDDLGGVNQAPNFTICGLTPGATYYLLHDASTFTAGNYAISIYAINLNAGVEGEVLEVCYGGSVDLFNGIANNQTGGTWTQTIPTLGLQGSTFSTNGLASVMFEFTYTVQDGCASDDVNAYVNVNATSSAGNNGTFTVCKNEPFNLLSGLSGTVDLGGVWLDPSNNQLAGDLDTASNIPGSFNYDYIVANGVCPADTATVLVIVDGSCDFTAGIETIAGSFSVYPNPTSSSVFVNNSMEINLDKIELIDMSGRVVLVAEKGSFNNSLVELDVNNLTTGVYTIKMTSGQASYNQRLIKQ